MISLCAMHAGDMGAFSVLPGAARIVGTVRTFNPRCRNWWKKRLKRNVQRHRPGLWRHGHGALRAHLPGHHQHRGRGAVCGRRGRALVGADHVVRDLEPSMGAEDFSFMLQTKPGAYLRIGQGTGASGSALHNSRYDFNDDILPLGSAPCTPA